MDRSTSIIRKRLEVCAVLMLALLICIYSPVRAFPRADAANDEILQEPAFPEEQELSEEQELVEEQELAEGKDPAQEQDLSEVLKISELMPSNVVSLFDEDGDPSDWLELVNTGDLPVSLQNCYLTNDTSQLKKWKFPDLILDSGDCVLVFCSGKNRADGELHASFKLSKSGDTIVLSTASGQLLDSVAYGETKKDMSVVFLAEDGTPLQEPNYTYRISPGFPNSMEGHEDYLLSFDQHGTLSINEAVSYNDEDFPERKGKYYDWIELKNTGNHTILLSDYFLSDDSDDLYKCRLPEVSLSPGELFLVYCSGNSALTNPSYFHANFAIGANECLYLLTRDGILSDEVHIHDIPLKGSLGRLPDRAGFFYFTEPTPGAENSSGTRFISSMPTASLPQGVYNESSMLSVKLQGDGRIYYTLDGSEPDSSDIEYVVPLKVSKTTIIRAVCQEPGCLPSKVATFSYIVNENDTLPVTSLVCDPSDMFRPSGVYYGSRALHAKADANISFFELDGAGFSADCSVELHGAKSRTTFLKKSFELKFSGRYGGNLHYDLFGDGQVTEFSSLLLRGGSNVSLVTVKDSFASEVVYDVCPMLYPQDVRFTVVYINGEYYGIYAWREAYSEHYFETHTGADKDGVQMVRAPLSSGELWELITKYSTRNLSDPEIYAELSSKLDLESLAGWLAMEAYFDNRDINGNIRYVKLGETEKWQLILYDLDYTCVTPNAGWGLTLETYQLGLLCKTLLKNSDFRTLLLEQCAEIYHLGFTADRILASYDSMVMQLNDEAVQKDCARWNESFAKWQQNIASMRSRIGESRMASWLDGLKKYTAASNEQMHEYFPDYY